MSVIRVKNRRRYGRRWMPYQGLSKRDRERAERVDRRALVTPSKPPPPTPEEEDLARQARRLAWIKKRHRLLKEALQG